MQFVGKLTKHIAFLQGHGLKIGVLIVDEDLSVAPLRIGDGPPLSQGRGNWLGYDFETISGCQRQILDQALEFQFPIWVIDFHWRDLEEAPRTHEKLRVPASPSDWARIRPGIKSQLSAPAGDPLEGAQVTRFTKPAANAFLQTDLKDALAASELRMVIVMGHDANACVKATSIAACRHGFHVLTSPKILRGTKPEDDFIKAPEVYFYDDV